MEDRCTSTLTRVVRGRVLSEREKDYALAARALGAPRWRVLLRYMRLSVLHYIGAAVCLVLAGLTLYELLR